MNPEGLDSYPRVELGCYPTPLEPLTHLTAQLGRELYIKRDDEIGPALGGNKARKLEYLMGEALESGERRVVTFGGLQSNHARMTAAAARRVGLEPHIFYFNRRPRRLTGNLQLNEILGARMHFIPFGSGGDPSMTLEATNRLVHLIAKAWIGKHYFIPVGGHSWRGCLGYVRAAVELDEQARSMGLPNPWIVLAAGTGGTLAGLLAGLHLINSPLRVLGIDVGKLWKLFPGSVAKLASELCARLGQPHHFSAEDIPLIEHRYVGQCYGTCSASGNAAVRCLAETEGIVLDPIYTGKAFAGMLDLIVMEHFGKREPVIFLHTGGVPGLFAFAEDFARD